LYWRWPNTTEKIAKALGMIDPTEAQHKLTCSGAKSFHIICLTHCTEDEMKNILDEIEKLVIVLNICRLDIEL
jgi:hypothetical protein